MPKPTALTFFWSSSSSSPSSSSSSSSSFVSLFLLALALFPSNMMAFTRTIRAGLIPLRLSTTKSLSQSPASGGATPKRWETTGGRSAGAMGLPCVNDNNNDESQSITAVDSTAIMAETMTGWTVGDALDESIQRLTKKNVTEPDYSALYLMAAALELPWERGIRDLENDQRSGNGLKSTLLSTPQAYNLEAMLKLRENHEPIQYVLGQWDFLDYTIAIRKPLLCPRPETEELVMMVAAATKKSPVRILDVGCGTGVIGISLAELLDDATVEAIDVEPIAIETSMENARRVLRRGDNHQGIESNQQHPGCYRAKLVAANDYTPDHPFDVVVSNPPYIPRSDMEGLSEDVTRYESDTALCGGMDGMDVITTIIQRLPEWCNRDAVCWMEVDPSHPKLIEEFLAPPSSSGETRGDESKSGKGNDNEQKLTSSRKTVLFESSHKDMFGKDRFVKLRVV